MSSQSSQIKSDPLDAIARIVSSAPPLNESQRSRIAALIRPASGDRFTESFRAVIRSKR